MGSARVLVVDDSSVVRKVVSQVVASIVGVAEVQASSNGKLALARLDQERFDLVILDIDMPELDGIETLRRMRVRHPETPVLMFSALTERAGHLTLDALSLGARDYITKPTTLVAADGALEPLRAELVRKVATLLTPKERGGLPGERGAVRQSTAVAVGREASAADSTVELLVIAASTGGPVALTELLVALPGDLPVPVAIVQHMPPMFTRLFASRLDELCALRVREAEPGRPLRPGEVVLAPGDFHVQVHGVRDHLFVATDHGAPENSCRPSADVLFRSAARSCGVGALGLVLTGMGEDGMRGARAIREAGGRVMVQDEASSVVWGMPGAVVRASLANAIVPLAELPIRLLAWIAPDPSQVRVARSSEHPR